MDLLTRTYRNIQRLLGPDAWFSYAILAVLIMLEIAGRHQPGTDFHDLMTVMVLSLLGWLIAIRHKQVPLPWVRLLQNWGQRGFAYLWPRIDVGLDFRGSPPLPRALPPTVLRALGILFVWLAVLLPFVTELPQGLRSVGIRITYIGYLAVLSALWAALLLSMFSAFFLTWAILHDAVLGRSGSRSHRRVRIEFVVPALYFVCLLILSRVLPPWLPLVICAVALTINWLTVVVPSNPDVKFVWRQRQGDSPIWSIPWPRYVLSEFSVMALIAVNLVLAACGSVVVADARPAFQEMPITSSLGLMLAWLAPGLLTLLVIQCVLGRLRDPARPCRPVVHVGGAGLEQHRLTLKAFFALRGWQARFAPARPDPLDVCVALTAGAEPDFEASWPLHVDAVVLQQETTFQRLVRRDEIQKRRRLIAGLERLFKTAAAHKARRSTGLWIAPHYWFVLGLTRDLPDDERDMGDGTLFTGIVGPPYHRVLPRPVRHHAYRILRALQIDLIFVEDGVTFKRFTRVLRMLFEIYDVHGGRRRADEVHFHGLPGTRVLIHEFVLNEPFRSDTYPEPEYENLGRARILHVFRDRGEHEEPLEVPGDFSHMPAPAGMF
jgi:hypothetical protein